MKLRKILFLMLSALAITPAAAQDSIRTSLVTCEPGTLVYEVYGHTAIRVENLTRGTDLVYNYGMFDFSTPHFIWRFSLGQTEYFVSAQRFGGFMREYDARGSKVWVQELDLTPEGHRALASALAFNSLPENRMYHYDFLYNNCASMALDKIEESADGPITYCLPDSAMTFRQLLHEGNSFEPWNKFAVDLVLGSEADRPITVRQASFSPLRLMQMASMSEITDTAGTVRPLVKSVTVLEPSADKVMPSCLLDPMQTMMLLFLLTLAVCCLEWFLRKAIWGYDIFLFGLQGVAGLLIAFLYFLSEHPAVDTNWLVICLNPLPLVCLPFLVHNIRKKQMDLFLILDFIVCLVFVLCVRILPQEIHPATLVLIGTFALRALSDSLMLIGQNHKTTYAKKSVVKVLLPALLLLAAAPSNAQSKVQNKAPKLVVGIVVDQLDGTILERLMPQFGNDGFRLLQTEGYYRTNVSFDFDGADRASALASIWTGSSPYYHGIVGEKWLDRSTLAVTGAVDDSQESGINTIYRSSPKHLSAANLADVMFIESNASAIICSVAAERDAAILAAGHEADAVLWINDTDCQWAGTSYYGGMPYWAVDANMEPWQKAEWKPRYPEGNYLRTGKPFESFSYSFGRGETVNFKTSPLANDKVTDMALRSIRRLALEMGNSPSLLAVTYYAGGLAHKKVGIESTELQDTYIRLDKNIAELISGVEKIMGAGNTVYFLTSTGYTDTSVPDLSQTRVPKGTVSMERAAALLNLYLSAIHEQGEYITAAYGHDMYLDRKMIEDRGLSLHTILEDCKDLLLQMSGIRNVLTQRDMLSGNLNDAAMRRRNALNVDCSGDLIIEVSPGWTITDSFNSDGSYVSRSSRAFPVILYGAGIHAEVNHEPISASFLASTLAYMLGVSTPPACSEKPLTNLR